MKMSDQTDQNAMVLFAELFQHLDKDGNEQITWTEFVEFQLNSRRVLKADWPIDMKSIRREFAELDKDANGLISKKEFLSAFANLRINTDNFQTVCNMVEAVLNQQSSAQFGNSAKEEFIKKMMADFDKADKDGNGQIDFMEFLRTKWDNGKASTHNLSMAQVRREFRRMDSNHDGTISREEFRATAEKLFYEREFPK